MAGPEILCPVDRRPAPFFAIGIEYPACQEAAVVNEAVGNALKEAERLLVDRFGTIGLGALIRAFDGRRGSIKGLTRLKPALVLAFDAGAIGFARNW